MALDIPERLLGDAKERQFSARRDPARHIVHHQSRPNRGALAELRNQAPDGRREAKVVKDQRPKVAAEASKLVANILCGPARLQESLRHAGRKLDVRCIRHRIQAAAEKNG
jgi:hypothetical protein